MIGKQIQKKDNHNRKSDMYIKSVMYEPRLHNWPLSSFEPSPRLL